MSRPKILATSIAALATLGLLSATTACSADVADSVVEAAAPPSASPFASMSPPATVSGADSAAGGSETGRAAPSGRQADKATQVHMAVVNNTGETLQIIGWKSSGKGNHWTTQPTNLAQGQSQIVSNYAAGDAQIDLQYKGETTGAIFVLHGETPLVGSNQATGSDNSTSYIVQAKAASGYNPTFNYLMEPGHTFTYTGHAETYTVPPGVTDLRVTASGGAGGRQGNADGRQAGGAEITGHLAVTPGEVLTVGVGGVGMCDDSDVTPGWGLTDSGNNNYSGGSGQVSPGSNACAGGGATVIYSGTDDLQPVLIAGGGGGHGAGGTGGQQGQNGGRAGYNGSWTGESGQVYPGGGGKAGGQSGMQGQEAPQGGDFAGGAGGGGANGGLAGSTGNGSGGGAGSSAISSAVSQATIQTAPTTGQTKNGDPGAVTFLIGNWN